MVEIIDAFVAGLPARMDALREAVDAGADDEAKRLAHQLKGAAGGYGFAPITVAAGELELAVGRGAGRDETRALAARLIAVGERARACEAVPETG